MDASGKAITVRILRLAEMLLSSLNKDMARVGLKYSIYSIIATLRTSGAPAPYQMTPTQLKSALVVTSGGLSNLLKETEALGLIKRSTDPNDKRGIIVELTKAGIDLCEQTMPMQVELEQYLVQMFTPEEKDALAMLLRKMILKNRIT